MRGTSRALHQPNSEKRASNSAYSIHPGFRAWLGLVPRDHRKLLVVDGAVGITGGVGVGREWTTGVQKQHRSRWRDTAVKHRGPGRARHGAGVRQHVAARDRNGAPRIAPVSSTAARAARTSIPRPTSRRSSASSRASRCACASSRALQIQAISAERSIWIATAYFTPSPSEVEALNGAARDGVDVRILVPSRNDHPWVSMLARRYYRRLLTNGVRIWEWQGEMMHAKTSVVDGRWVRVGSTDFNPLGVAINYELDAVIEDAVLGQQAEEMFLADLDASREVTL